MFHPTTFGNYFLTRRLAIGGMAEVFAAKLYGADGFEKDLVIKQILPQYARDPEFVQSFVAEAKLAVGLNHANIVAIYELGRVDGTYFIAMEFVDGLDVYTMIHSAKAAEAPIDPGLGVMIVEDVARGLEHAHGKKDRDGRSIGLVHRDLNPRNVLVSKAGEAKILDFGIAKTIEGASAMPRTRTGIVKGTVGYMSPEQASGRDVDARTDIYQAGLLLFELVTGSALFWRPDDGETRERVHRHDVVAPSTVRAEIPRALDEIVLRALERDPNARIATAAEFTAMLEKIRVACFPTATRQRLGRTVEALMQSESLRVAEVTAEAPSTIEISSVIDASRATTGGIETLATRPIREHATTRRSSHPPPSDSAVEAFAPDAVTSTPSSTERAPHGHRRRSTLFAAVAMGCAAAAIIVVRDLRAPLQTQQVGNDPTTADTASRTQSMEAVPADPLPAPSATEDGAPTTSVTTVRTPSVESHRAQPRIQRATEPLALARVSFGTRSCSGRVFLDGRMLAQHLPSFDREIAPGKHVVRFEGSECTATEVPGSLERSIPVVTGPIDLLPGAEVKIIVDFRNRTIAVR